MKTLVVGLDGIADNFWTGYPAGELVDHHGQLETYYSTFPSFMCSLTGKQMDASLQQEYTTHRIGHKMLWDYLEVRQGYFNVPCIYPAEDINGFMVSGCKAEDLTSETVRPINLIPKLKEMDYYWGLNLFGAMTVAGRWDDFLDEALKQLDMRTRTTIQLASQYQPQLLFLVYTVTDQCLHERGDRLGEDRIHQLKTHLTEKLETLVDTLQADTVLFFSDHSINMRGYHGPDYPTTKWGTWALKSPLEFIPPSDKAHILDIFPTILCSLDVDLPPVKGHSLLVPPSTTSRFQQRMERLGYLQGED